jgi:glycerol-3-phosphate dehydrogenase (NAD(P)+)
MSKIAILGAGSWGTALAIVLSRSPREHEIRLWARDAALAVSLQNERENRTYLPGCKLSSSVQPTDSLFSALDGAEIVVSAIPSAHVRAVFKQTLPYLRNRVPVVSATKGLEAMTHLRMSEVLMEALSANFLAELAVLSGPSFAFEAAQGEPTAVVVASPKLDGRTPLANRIQEEFAAPGFRLYTNEDVLGVELAGAMKNVIAIAAGVCQGLGLGANAQAALLTRGLAEMTRLAVALGARPETLAGLAGLGDLVLTCHGALSRNRSVGIQLGEGRALADILRGMQMVAEGVGTTAPLLALARQHHVDLPITEQVDAILHRNRPPREAIREIMERPQKHESK